MIENELFDSYLSLLRKWNKKINLVQSETLSDAFQRHIKDSMQIRNLLNKDSLIIDIGSGSGLPGVILSILGFKNIILCEKNFKKSVFLKNVKSKLNLNFEIFNDDIYNFSENKKTSSGAFSEIVAVSRAFGSLEKLLDIMCFLEITKGVFHKGETWEGEIKEAFEIFDFEYEIQKSETNPNSVIIKIDNVRRK